jgi:O-antigen/teichoic acid export membrane protein
MSGLYDIVEGALMWGLVVFTIGLIIYLGYLQYRRIRRHRSRHRHRSRRSTRQPYWRIARHRPDHDQPP